MDLQSINKEFDNLSQKAKDIQNIMDNILVEAERRMDSFSIWIDYMKEEETLYKSYLESLNKPKKI